MKKDEREILSLAAFLAAVVLFSVLVGLFSSTPPTACAAVRSPDEGCG